MRGALGLAARCGEQCFRCATRLTIALGLKRERGVLGRRREACAYAADATTAVSSEIGQAFGDAEGRTLRATCGNESCDDTIDFGFVSDG